LNPITNGRDFLNRVVQRQNNDVQTDEERFFVSTFQIKIKNRYRTIRVFLLRFTTGNAKFGIDFYLSRFSCPVSKNSNSVLTDF
jgi:hypothetical protein